MSSHEPPPVLTRTWNYAAPSWRLFEALAAERDRWLSGPDAESVEVIESVHPSRVVLRPWLDHQVDRVEVVIHAYGPGSKLIVSALLRTSDLDDTDRRRVRHQLGVSFGSALRDHVDGW